MGTKPIFNDGSKDRLSARKEEIVGWRRGVTFVATACIFTGFIEQNPNVFAIEKEGPSEAINKNNNNNGLQRGPSKLFLSSDIGCYVSHVNTGKKADGRRSKFNTDAI